MCRTLIGERQRSAVEVARSLHQGVQLLGPSGWLGHSTRRASGPHPDQRNSSGDRREDPWPNDGRFHHNDLAEAFHEAAYEIVSPLLREKGNLGILHDVFAKTVDEALFNLAFAHSFADSVFDEPAKLNAKAVLLDVSALPYDAVAAAVAVHARRDSLEYGNLRGIREVLRSSTLGIRGLKACENHEEAGENEGRKSAKAHTRLFDECLTQNNQNLNVAAPILFSSDMRSCPGLRRHRSVYGVVRGETFVDGFLRSRTTRG